MSTAVVEASPLPPDPASLPQQQLFATPPPPSPPQQGVHALKRAPPLLFPGSTLFNGSYAVLGRLGTGAYGEVYRARYTTTGTSVALKVARTAAGQVQMRREVLAYAHCKGTCAGLAAPTVHWSGPLGDASVMILECLGDDLETLTGICGGRISSGASSTLAPQMLSILETLHCEGGCLHLDVKPSNFALRTPKDIAILDFGLARLWRSPGTGKHIPATVDPARFCGTPRFCSVRAHAGHSPSRRDDLESLGYTLMYLLEGSLPWQHCTTSEQVAREKAAVLADPAPFLPSCSCAAVTALRRFFAHVTMLGVEEEPGYAALHEAFREWGAAEGMEGADTLLDWERQHQRPRRRRQPPAASALLPPLPQQRPLSAAPPQSQRHSRPSRHRQTRRAVLPSPC